MLPLADLPLRLPSAEADARERERERSPPRRVESPESPESQESPGAAANKQYTYYFS